MKEILDFSIRLAVALVIGIVTISLLSGGFYLVTGGLPFGIFSEVIHAVAVGLSMGYFFYFSQVWKRTKKRKSFHDSDP